MKEKTKNEIKTMAENCKFEQIGLKFKTVTELIEFNADEDLQKLAKDYCKYFEISSSFGFELKYVKIEKVFGVWRFYVSPARINYLMYSINN